jgi:hypothetical protein
LRPDKGQKKVAAAKGRLSIRGDPESTAAETLILSFLIAFREAVSPCERRLAGQAKSHNPGTVLPIEDPRFAVACQGATAAGGRVPQIAGGGAKSGDRLTLREICESLES